MAHGYQNLHHWNLWLAREDLGARLIQEEARILTALLSRHFGKHALICGVPHQEPLLNAIRLPCHTLLTPLLCRDKTAHLIEGDLHELPLLTGSVDLVVLPHTLEFIDNPRQLLAEACRVIKPEGLIVLFGFNPYSAWGVKKMLSKFQSTPWLGNLINAQSIKNWLSLADFEMENQSSALFLPPMKNTAISQKLAFIDQIGNKCFPALGGIYALVARAKVIPLTPIKMKWKQQLSGVRIASTISGHIARRQSK